MSKRRKLLLALSGASAATVWKKPIVSSVMLPAHAATSYQITCVGNPLDGTSAPNLSPFQVTITVTPNPGVVQLTETVLCNGISDEVLSQMTDANGMYISNNYIFGNCSSGQEFTIRYEFMGASTQCSWTLTDSV